MVFFIAEATKNNKIIKFNECYLMVLEHYQLDVYKIHRVREECLSIAVNFFFSHKYKEHCFHLIVSWYQQFDKTLNYFVPLGEVLCCIPIVAEATKKIN